MFQGSNALALDAKGRLTVPTRHRDALMVQCDGELTLTRKPRVDEQSMPDTCLLVYPRPVWKGKLAEIDRFATNAEHWRRRLIGGALDVNIDSAGRILISPELRAAALLVRDVMLVGMGGHFELWDVEEFKRREAEDMMLGTPPGLENFSF